MTTIDDGQNSLKTIFAPKESLASSTGPFSQPPSTFNDYTGWVTINSSIEPKNHNVILVVDNARVVWESLRTRFSAGNALRVHQLKAGLVTCHQDGQEVLAYFGRLKVMWDDLEIYEPKIRCCCNNRTCPILIKHNKRRDHERIHHFLMGIDASRFIITSTNLLRRLTREQDLTLDQIYSKLITEERHITVSCSKKERVDDVSFAVQS